MKLSELAKKLGCHLEGPDVEITGVAGMEHAEPGQLTFLANRSISGFSRRRAHRRSCSKRA